MRIFLTSPEGSGSVPISPSSSLFFLQRNESELEGMAVASSNLGDDNPADSPSTNPDDNEGHKEASGKKKKNRCLSCKKKVGLTGN